ncbi:MAG: 16S rRNA (cytidine(1402)-2'-O)-methyltransferase [Micrococcaceae bacterium]
MLVHGTLTLAGTPIGNSKDASLRLREALETFPIIAAEDTRTLKQLLHRLGINTEARLISYHEHNERNRSAELIELLQNGQDILVVSDAGMPTVSDPGFSVVNAAIEANCPVSVIPGPSAVLAALAVSGLPTNKFTFEGFIPKKNNERKNFLTELKAEKRTMVFFEAPHRIIKTVKAITEIFGYNRQLVLARELTKRFEEIIRGTTLEVLESITVKPPKGEIVLVLAGHTPKPASIADGLTEVKQLVSTGIRLKDACKQIAKETGLSSKQLYDAMVNR